jgi:hypothetical protein
MPKKTLKCFTAPEKVPILRLHLLEHALISGLCNWHSVQPSMLYC